MTKEEKIKLLNELLALEEKNDVGNLTSRDRADFQMWVKEALEQEPKTVVAKNATTEQVGNSDKLDCISRQAAIKALNTMDRYVSEELTLCDTDKKFPANEVFVVDDVYEEIVEQLPPVNPQEPKTDVLDKIRAEIQSASMGKWYTGRVDGKTDEVVLMDDVMGIIDKYRGEG